MPPLITQNLELAVSSLNAGNLVAIPTETVYGLAAVINQDTAIRAVFTLKNRPLTHPLIVHVSEHFDLNTLVNDIPSYAFKLMEQFWPGPLTLVFHAKENALNSLITGGQSTVALRCPAHPLTQQLLAMLDTPLVAPSANPFGKISPTTAVHVQQSFPNDNLLILDGGRCNVGIESTIVNATDPNEYQILRQGILDEKTLISVSAACSNSQNLKNIRVSGNLKTHYQPQKPLYYFDSNQTLERFCEQHPNKVFVISSQKPHQVTDHHFAFFSKQPKQAAFDLYDLLRKADASDATYLAIELPPDVSECLGVKERILKAGTHWPIDKAL